MSDATKAAVITGIFGLVGIVLTIFATLYVERQKQRQPGNFAGVYEWQWAGDGWLGYLNVDRNGYTHLEMKKWTICGGTTKMVSLLKQEGEGKAVVNDEGTEMVVTIPVRPAIVDSACYVKGLGNVVTLRGTLSRKVAFAGPIAYQTSEAAPIGDMVLVKDFTSGPH
jgi:hypothetical protein